ncbi:MAG: hypothetical protein HY074_05410 [Deltaproteobacteria bacterium]|nr:hypothetical protein [Deltaproteobacteria bacterium]
MNARLLSAAAGAAHVLMKASPCLVALVALLASGCAKDEHTVVPCAQLDVGQSKTISGNTGTRLRSTYTLTRLSDTAWRATIDPIFSDSTGGENAAIHARYRAKLEACLVRVRPLLRGPGGATLDIKLAAAGQTEVPQPPSIAVRTDEHSSVRGNSEFWNMSVGDCATMLHETLHWLGLPDEYRETEWNEECRSIGPANSIMRSPSNAFVAALADVSMTRQSCLCSDQACIDQVVQIRGTRNAGCPAHSVHYLEKYWHSEHPEWKSTDNFATPQGTLVTLSLRADIDGGSTRSSLLFDGEFRAITQPGCTQANSLFYSCSHYAYSQTRAIFQMNLSCEQLLPVECRDPQRWVQ